MQGNGEGIESVIKIEDIYKWGVSQKIFQSVVMNFPKTVLLYYGSLRVGSIPYERAFDVLKEPNKLLSGPVCSILFIPELSPLAVIFGDAVPPYFRTEGFITLFGVPQPEPPI